eukprot:CAMPEP_0119221686 /NCGR_PEP_ID=MMETSP1327-20130426/28968_1 /TAXON_ID=38833 /ORGANISM="Micromonas pusilla, Strain RCC2306" /LENGTH=83 /DNA_ID=CAMNT_0007219865 /DNA_START=23 /DNA_END=273 /DNA_ORIENTATION=+
MAMGDVLGAENSDLPHVRVPSVLVVGKHGELYEIRPQRRAGKRRVLFFIFVECIFVFGTVVAAVQPDPRPPHWLVKIHHTDLA